MCYNSLVFAESKSVRLEARTDYRPKQKYALPEGQIKTRPSLKLIFRATIAS
ncbi:MAG: hypothetical protein US96_C0001G0042 [Candidatus Woesebacteria bacterium GW2011_GWB1_38_5b]|uniref:Uncharacterized protein n=1 Tax=Candidatus Woesebacteria bacterium GW2011_GWB1_38_5b TaxID=1618569 RepID=A0A0G0NFS4_9BACT|nr:MAG: hypothetical protein US96_C0001G0042 [Candidatus Woesebacteria bacterium GW2011_GWB1_38_5b]